MGLHAATYGFGFDVQEMIVTAIARALARRLQLNETDTETLKLIVMFCGVGLLITLLYAAYGLDLAFDFL
jgi:hypothetical protein